MNDLLSKYVTLAHKGAANIQELCDLGKRLKDAGFENEGDSCFNACIQALQRAIEKGDVEAALAIESLLYNPFIKSTETEEHYFKCFARWSLQLQELGRKYNRPLKPDRNRRSVCFVLHTGVLLGHTEVMFRVIDSWIKQGIKCELYVAVIQGCQPEFKEMLNKRGIKLLQPRSRSYGAILAEIRDSLEQRKISTGVWLGPAVLMGYALAMRLSPRQVVWSVKFHPVWVPEVDVHICGGHELETTRNYNGHDWTVAQFPLTLDPIANNPVKVKAIRDLFQPNAIVLGSLAREEKLKSPEFLSAVCKLLARNAQAHYIWTGRSQPEMVLSAFKNAGVMDRCHFVGWVDTNLYAEALDIFLETFPFGCGITGFQSMSHGTPLLSKADADTLYGSQLRGGVMQKFMRRSLSHADYETLGILTAADSQHYVELAQRLIDDIDFREEIGAREKAYYQNERDALPRYAKRLWVNITGLEM